MIYEMFQFAECATIFAYTMIEGLVNYSIPENYSYKRDVKNGITEVLDKYAIERNLSLSDKLKNIISPIFAKKI